MEENSTSAPDVDAAQESRAVAGDEERVIPVKRPVGRPSTISKEKIERFREALASGATIQQSCAYAGVNQRMYYTWISYADKKGGLFAELRDVVKKSIASASIKSLEQITRAADEDWRAAAWHVERSERILERLDGEPDVVRAHRLRMREWDKYAFTGGAAIKKKKVDVLAHLEDKFTVVAACRAARVPRYQFKQWVAEDDTFAACSQEAMMVAVMNVESVMFEQATKGDRKGKIQTTACFGILNAKTEDYGLLKAQLFQRTNAKFLDEVGRELLADLPPEVAIKLRERLDSISDRASRLPPGASLR